MVEHGVEDHADATCVQGVDHAGEAFIRSQPAVDLAQVARVVSVCVTREDRIEQNGTHTEFTQVWCPLDERAHAVQGTFALLAVGVVDGGGVERAVEHAQGIHLVERRIKNPHDKALRKAWSSVAPTGGAKKAQASAYRVAGICRRVAR